jgi:hypothetical protein
MRKVFLSGFILLIFNILALAQGDIRRIDFNNFTYAPYCGGEEPKEVTVKNAEFSGERQTEDSTDRFYFKAFSISYGDLNGDGNDEAFVLSLCSAGTNSYLSEGFVYTLRNGKPVLMTRIEGGDRGHGGLRSARVEKGIFVVERYAVDATGEACCPEFYISMNYKWNGREFVEVDMPTRREVYPSTPVSFEKGKTSATINVNLKNAKFKRYVVSGRGGQTLTVSTNSKTVSMKLVRGEADANENEKGFIAVLNDDGNFVIQIENISGADADAVVKIEVK